MTLRETLTDWSDWDDAAHAYGRALGIFDGADRRQVNQIVLSDNPLGAGLHAGMLALVEAGVVERRDEPDEQFRWIFGSVSDILGPISPMAGMSSTNDLPDLRPTDLPGVSGVPTGDGKRRRWWQRR